MSVDRTIKSLGLILLLVSVAASAFGQTVPEEAQRRLVRGVTAVKMAQSSLDLEDAVKEFQEAARLAPDWPDAWYNLGLIQEKVGKFKEAVASLKKHLALAPDDPAASEIRTMIYELEYKAEQILTIPEIVDILTGGTGRWYHMDDSGVLQPTEGSGGVWGMTRIDDQTVRVATLRDYSPKGVIDSYSPLIITGPVVTFSRRAIMFNNHLKKYDIVVNTDIRIEVVSRTHVKEQWTQRDSSQPGPTERFYEYRKK